jgi:hypothetical protein
MPQIPPGRRCEDPQSRRNKVHDSGEEQVGTVVAGVAGMRMGVLRTAKPHDDNEAESRVRDDPAEYL